MKVAITITLLVVGVIAALGGIAHEDPRRGKNSAIYVSMPIGCCLPPEDSEI